MSDPTLPDLVELGAHADYEVACARSYARMVLGRPTRPWDDLSAEAQDLHRERAGAVLAAVLPVYREQVLREPRIAVHGPTPWEIRRLATGGGPCPTCTRPYWTHVCLSCSPDYQTPGPGCHNCRNSGMDQTPCLPPTETPDA